MSKLGGVILIVAGVGIAAYTLTGSGESSIKTSALPQDKAAKPAQAPPPVEVAPAQPVPAPVAKTAAAPPAANDSAGPPAPPPVTVEVAAPPVVIPAPVPVKEAAVQPVPDVAPKANVVRPALTAGPPLDRAGLAKALQRELKRVGCYGGDVNGVWTPDARRSMKAFTDRVNATLPVAEPDYILLAMVQGHQGQACGRTCPAGQGLAQDGRCLPNSVVAAASKKRPVADLQGQPTQPKSTVKTESGAPPSGLMALAGPKQDPVQATRKGEPGMGPASAKQGKPKVRHARTTRRPWYADRYIESWEPWRPRFPAWWPG